MPVKVAILPVNDVHLSLYFVLDLLFCGLCVNEAAKLETKLTKLKM